MPQKDREESQCLLWGGFQDLVPEPWMGRGRIMGNPTQSGAQGKGAAHRGHSTVRTK